MIDLHIHTTYSDGKWDLKDVLKQAEKRKLDFISITDHDTLNPYKDLEKNDYSKIFTGKIITGIEFSTVYENVAFHMLAYDFNYKNLLNFIKQNYENRKVDLNLEFQYSKNNCLKHGIKLDEIKFDETKGWPVDFIYDGVKKYNENKKFFTEKEWNDIKIFYRASVSDRNFPAFVDYSIHYPNAKIISQEVKKAGGKVFIAHIYRYNLKDNEAFLNKLKNDNIIDGVEVYHSSYNDEESENLIKYCKLNNLLMSGGTDFHGNQNQMQEIGIGYGNMNISNNLLKDWNLKN